MPAESWGKTACTSSDSASVPNRASIWLSRSRRRRSASQIRQCSTTEPSSAAIGRSSCWCSSVKARGWEALSQTPPLQLSPMRKDSHIAERTRFSINLASKS